MLKIIKAIIQAIKRRFCRHEINLDQYGNDYEEFDENIIAFARLAAASTSISYAAAISLARATAEAAQAAANLFDNSFVGFLHKLDELLKLPPPAGYENCNKATHKKKYTAAAVIQTVMYYKKPVRYTSGVPPNV